MRKPLLLLFFLGLLPISGYAQQSSDTLYQIDMVFFLHTSKSYRTEETWPKNIDLNWPEQYGLIVEQPESLDPQLKAQAMAIKKMANTNGLIADDAEKLDKLPRYKVVKHLSFVTSLGKETNATNWVIDETITDKHGQQNRIAGTFKLYKKRFLHLKTKLWIAIAGKEETQASLAEETPAAIDTTQTLTVSPDTASAEEEIEETVENWPTLPPYLMAATTDEAKDESAPDAFSNIELISTLEQHRKLRSKEKHYIDHPLFGVLLYIKPLENQG